MSRTELDRARIESLLAAATAKLDGDWLLVGGALVAVWLEPRRVTEDVDLIGLSGTPADRLSLMDLAEQEGLPVEAVNSAADFFLFRIAGWQEELEPFMAGPRARILRPSPTLFLLLKIGRLSEQDLADCLAVLSKVEADHLDLDTARVVEALAALPATDDDAARERRLELETRLRTVGAVRR